jgi:hypothetical protein
MIFWLFYLYSLFRWRITFCLSRGVQVVGAACHTATRIVVVVGDLVQRIGDGRTGRILGGRAIERSGDAVCGLHHARVSWLSLKTKVDDFFSGLALKNDSSDLVILASKLSH